MVAGGREHADKRQGNGKWHEPTRRVRSEGPNKSHPFESKAAFMAVFLFYLLSGMR